MKSIHDCITFSSDDSSGLLQTLMYYSKQATSQLLFTTSKISIHSFILSNCFILYLELPIDLLQCFQEMGGKRRTGRKPTWIWGENIWKSAQTETRARDWTSPVTLLQWGGSNPRPKLKCQNDFIQLYSFYNSMRKRAASQIFSKAAYWEWTAIAKRICILEYVIFKLHCYHLTDIDNGVILAPRLGAPASQRHQYKDHTFLNRRPNVFSIFFYKISKGKPGVSLFVIKVMWLCI